MAEAPMSPLPPDAVLYPDSGFRTDGHALSLWAAHMYDTGGEPYYSAETVDALRARIEELEGANILERSANRMLRADAHRYRLIRAHGEVTIPLPGVSPNTLYRDTPKDEWDATIDAASVTLNLSESAGPTPLHRHGGRNG